MTQDLIASLDEFIKQQNEELRIEMFYLEKSHDWINGAVANRVYMLNKLKSILEAAKLDSSSNQ